MKIGTKAEIRDWLLSPERADLLRNGRFHSGDVARAAFEFNFLCFQAAVDLLMFRNLVARFVMRTPPSPPFFPDDGRSPENRFADEVARYITKFVLPVGWEGREEVLLRILPAPTELLTSVKVGVNEMGEDGEWVFVLTQRPPIPGGPVFVSYPITMEGEELHWIDALPEVEG